ncbi:MAG: Flp pilus assembly complex ATPase component TadA [Candidatus Aminicenantes bacterium]|nr:Flp pilus assembly complex ATPase component TadA [Candidatus Aminicenantes bacterium]
MINPQIPPKKILLIDDDYEFLELLNRFLQSEGYQASLASSGKVGLWLVQSVLPDLIFLDIQMPTMDGFEVCRRLRENQNLTHIPVIFLSAHGKEENKVKAFSLGGTEFLQKPISKEIFLNTVRAHLEKSEIWSGLKEEESKAQYAEPEKIQPQHVSFTAFLIDNVKFDPAREDQHLSLSSLNVYEDMEKVGIGKDKGAQLLAMYSGIEYISSLDPESVVLGILPYSFCKANKVIPVRDKGQQSFVITNPLNLALLDSLQKLQSGKALLNIKITDPTGMERFFDNLQDFDSSSDKKRMEAIPDKIHSGATKNDNWLESSQRIIDLSPKKKSYSIQDERLIKVIELTNKILVSAISQRASDIHIEPKEDKAFVRYRIDGEVQEASIIQPETCRGVISRLKVLSNLNIAETRRPQDGSVEAQMEGKKIKMRIATVGTPYGESIIIRIFDPQASVISLSDLGMNEGQIDSLKKMASSNRGLLLVVGPTGSGKTTTLYSLINSIETQTRSLISIEDPIEYTIPYANQMEINERINVTFENLLKSAMRQDPDILFLGEIRDIYSARMAVDAAGTGHLTLSTLHTLNATTAIFRLERLDVSRSALAESLLGVIAQRLVRKLCPHCKSIHDITDKEIEILKDFTQDLPQKVGHPVGCLQCNNSGYYGRMGTYEILRVDAHVANMIRNGLSIAEIRAYLYQCGEKLLFHQALDKIRETSLSVQEAFSNVLCEENPSDLENKSPIQITKEKEVPIQNILQQEEKNILVVDDDEDMQNLISLLLRKEKYHVTIADDGLDALTKIGKSSFDLILSDINMPNLDGIKLLEILTQKGIKTPVIYITSRTTQEDEIKGLSLGATDYIKKPISKEILLYRVKRTLQQSK